jgi:hypothetical protein
MSGPDEPSSTSRDPDDWFAEGGSRPSAPPPRRQADERTQETLDEPDWIEGEGETRESAGPPSTPAGLPRGRFALLGAAAFAVIVVIAFAAAGVFSSDKKNPSSAPPTTTEQTTTTQPTTPTTTPATPTTTPSTTVPPLPTGLLKQGTSGADVKAVQQALQAVGQAPGKIDGVFGGQTEQALMSFQQSVGLPADGVYGPQTKAELEKKLKSG